MTSLEARDIHEQARRDDVDHDQIGCWCCCWDCDFDAQEIWANDKAAEIESVV